MFSPRIELAPDKKGKMDREIAADASEIRRQSADFPIAVARRFGTVAAGNFLRALDRVPILLGAARLCLGQGALGRWR